MRRILQDIDYRVPLRLTLLTRIDALVLHPIAGPLLLAAVLFFMFQAVFSWAEVPMEAIAEGVQASGSIWRRRFRKDRCTACCSTASSPASAACSSFCRRS